MVFCSVPIFISKPTRNMALSILAVGLVSLTACQNLPKVAHLPKSTTLTQSLQTQQPTPLHHITKHTQNHLSGYYPLTTGADAFAARSILTQMAGSTIDIQYYIWHNDEAGQMMIKELWLAAERGVKIRLLLDDFNGSTKLDELLLAFAKHPNIAVRLSNPFAHRRVRAADYFSTPTRINRRMHNKSMTFDNHLSIIGGRNIGDEYLNNIKNNRTKNSTFADLDVLLAGVVVDDIRQSFEQYWTSSTSYDIETLVKPSQKTLGNLISPHIWQANQAGSTYHHAIENATIKQNLLQKNIPFRWVKIEFLADHADKLANTASLDTQLLGLLQARLGRPTHRLSIISSYFVPTKDGVRTLTQLAKNGIEVNILTNSFDATDVGAVHAGYGHWRRELLAAGVHLYELKATASNPNDNTIWRNKQAATTSLHAKAFAVDHEQVFIGSYNIDPRSAKFNTELGVLIHDQHLATQLHNALNSHQLLNHAYKVVLTKQNRLEWHTLKEGKYTIHQKEPNMSLRDRAGIAIMSILPIDWLL